MLDLIERKLLDFSKVSVICIDEADFMFDIGFQYDIDEIVSFIKDKTTK
jgi:superfamily II DNA/RNA helicase